MPRSPSPPRKNATKTSIKTTREILKRVHLYREFATRTDNPGRRPSLLKVAGALVEKGWKLAPDDFAPAAAPEGLDHTLMIEIDREIWADIARYATLRNYPLYLLANACLILALETEPIRA